MIATMILGDICDDCVHKSSQVLYSATCTDDNNKNNGEMCLDVSSCCNYESKDKDV